MSIQVQIKTPMDAYKLWLMNQRFKAFVKTWNEDVILIQGLAQATKRDFYWAQLVKQEIEMYIKLGEVVTAEELDALAKRREFTATETGYLHFLLTKVGLWKNQ